METEDNNRRCFIEQATDAFEYSLEHQLFDQAIFYAQAIQAHSHFSVESAVLLARALYQDGQIYRALETLSPFIPDNSRGQTRLTSAGVYLYARCCFSLEKYSDVISVLYPESKVVSAKGSSVFSFDKLDSVVNGAPGLLLMGQALERTGDRQGAAECYSKCLDVCPFMYEAYTRLSSLSFDNPKAVVPPSRFAKTYFGDASINSCSVLNSKAAASEAEPSSPVKVVSSASPSNLPIPPSLITNTPTKPGIRSLSRGVLSTPPVGAAKLRAHSPPTISKPSPGTTAVVPQSGYTLAEYLQTIGAAVHALNGFDVNIVVDYVSRLPPYHRDTLIVQGLLGKALMEAGRFPESEAAFATALKCSPAGIVEVIDMYSSVLWQLRKEAELAHLCTHGLRIANRARCHKLWIAVGNSFSIQKEPETAMKFINRSIQIDPSYAYSHVLMGHEFYAQDKFDRAKQCYTKAIELDPRCYNAYWGLGQIFTRQEEYSNAKYNLIKALEVNPKSSTVRFTLATVAMAMRENDLAYQQLGLAIELNPLNAPALCQKGVLELTVYGKIEQAKATLEQALAIAPQEAVIYVLLGKIAANSGARESAMQLYNTALDLLKGSKDNYGIKQSIEELDFVGQGFLSAAVPGEIVS